MARQGTETREKIMNAALDLIYESGYAGTSLDTVISRVGMTKGAFFHHFRSKRELARALLQRFAEADHRHMQEVLARAERLSRDPAQQLVIIVGLFIEMFEGLTEPWPGCLFASYTYELQQFDDDTRQVIADAYLAWRNALQPKVEAALAQHPPPVEVDAASLADAVTVVLEGAFVMSKAMLEPDLVARQLRHFRNYLELLFGLV
jgi:TetR/AcrR family transcriptional repressor of nem operon